MDDGADTADGDPVALVADRIAFDALVDRTDGIDRFCSSTDWIVPLHRCFGTGPVVLERAGDRAALALAVLPGSPGGRLLCGLDPMWGYACPVVGPDPVAGAELVATVLRARRGRIAGVVLTGIAPGGPLAAAVARRLGRHVAGHGEPVGRRIARLDDGLDGYLARRPRTFRRNARNATRRAGEAGVVFEWCDGGDTDPVGLVERAVRAERRSWKGRQDSGLGDPAFARFYREMAAGLADAGEGRRLRAGFAVLDGHDAGYILGAVRDDRYRGLQLAYAAEAGRLSLGNLLQLGQMERLAAEGVTHYDLGQDMAYKEVWSDELFVTDTVLLAC